jgi:hypothetical protein
VDSLPRRHEPDLQERRRPFDEPTLKEELLDRYAREESADPLLLPAIYVNLAELAMNDGEFERAQS